MTDELWSEVLETPGHEPDPSLTAETEEFFGYLRRGASLRGREYKFLRLTFIEGLDPRAIADKWGVSVQFVYECRRGAMEKVKELLETGSYETEKYRRAV